MKIALTIAGSDSGGGAGIQADLKTFEAHGVFGVTAITSITAQNTTGVRAVFDLPADAVREQLEAVFEDFELGAVKVGMLANVAIVREVAGFLRTNLGRVPLVLDPVMVSTSGDRLLRADAIDALVHEMFPLAALVTPNASEAEALTGLPVNGFDAMLAAAAAIRSMGAAAVLIKGGHIPMMLEGFAGPQSVDLLMEASGHTPLPAARIDTVHTHGTGCTLSSAIAAHLALGHGMRESVRRAKSYVFQAIATAPGIGRGHGPLLHRWRQALHEQSDS